ncbi:MAG: DUF4430 domain-containing protein [Firmicutes bacterium]|nr:DUF4430 domain-containing protein [Bacillota bacterium]
MNKCCVKKLLSILLCIALIAAMALCISGCGSKDTAETTAASEAAGATSVGEGQTEFRFTVVDADGKETAFDVHTDEKTVGAALLALGLIDGDDSEYGLYVKTVNGVTVDYDKDGKYWAFYIDGEYAATGVDSTDITAGSTYTFKVE